MAIAQFITTMEARPAAAAVPADPPAPEKKPQGRQPGTSPGNKYGIPPGVRTRDKKLYDRLFFRCRTKGLTYEEALKQDTGGRGDPAPVQDPPAAAVPVPPAPVATTLKEKYFMPDQPAPVQKTTTVFSRAGAKSLERFPVGTKVQQVSGRVIFDGPGTSRGINPHTGGVLVEWKNGTEWIAPNYLERVSPAGA